MSRFDIYRGRGVADYYLDVQSDFHVHLRTRVVIPLQTLDKVTHPTRGLYAVLMFDEKSYYLATPMMAAMTVQQLGKSIGNVQDQSHTITTAIDFLLQGF